MNRPNYETNYSIYRVFEDDERHVFGNSSLTKVAQWLGVTDNTVSVSISRNGEIYHSSGRWYKVYKDVFDMANKESDE
jgi:hypothetical protein